MGRKLFGSSFLAVFLLASGCSRQLSPSESPRSLMAGLEKAKKSMDDKSETSGFRQATFGAGCFWCVEAVFQRLEGVVKVVSGYSGGSVNQPTYEQVCTGVTGHAEVCQITYDPQKISYDKLLEVFWRTHDPTTKNRQGGDIGTQYRSIIFYHDEEQKRLAEGYKAKLGAEHIWERPVVTEIVPFRKFWPAEDYHQNYFNNNPDKGYCLLVINPKVEKFKQIFKDKLKQK